MGATPCIQRQAARINTIAVDCDLSEASGAAGGRSGSTSSSAKLPSSAAKSVKSTGNLAAGSKGRLAAVTLNIYNMGARGCSALNSVLRPLGTGAFHCGVQLYGREWSFSRMRWDENVIPQGEGCGIFACQPRSCPGHSFAEALPLGTTETTERELRRILVMLEKEWQSDDYDLLTKNCCHFCEALCFQLDLGPLPAWITNLAAAGASLATAELGPASCPGAAAAGAVCCQVLYERCGTLNHHGTLPPGELHFVPRFAKSYPCGYNTFADGYGNSEAAWNQRAYEYGLGRGQLVPEILRPGPQSNSYGCDTSDMNDVRETAELLKEVKEQIALLKDASGTLNSVLAAVTEANGRLRHEPGEKECSDVKQFAATEAQVEEEEAASAPADTQRVPFAPASDAPMPTVSGAVSSHSSAPARPEHSEAAAIGAQDSAASAAATAPPHSASGPARSVVSSMPASGAVSAGLVALAHSQGRGRGRGRAGPGRGGRGFGGRGGKGDGRGRGGGPAAGLLERR